MKLDEIRPDELFAAVGDKTNLQRVLDVFDLLDVDETWTSVIVEHLRLGRIETRCFMSWLAQTLKPKTYLEIGVRRGFSMAMVGARSPATSIYGFDMWIAGYGRSANPGPRFIREQLLRVGHTGRLALVSGNSHQMLPAFFGNRPASLINRWRVRSAAGEAPKSLDLILVDSEHSLLGAYQDLMDALPMVSVGGVLVFDDIAPDPADVDTEAVRAEAGEDPHGWRNLQGVWRAALKEHPEFKAFEYTDNTPGVALAVRVK